MKLESIPYAAFKALRRFVSEDETRYNLCGICLQFQKGKPVRMMASDGRRLAVLNLPLSVTFDRDGDLDRTEIIIPARAIDAMLASFQPNRDLLLIIKDRLTVTLACVFENHTITANVIDGVYPNFDSVISPLPTGFADGDTLLLNADFLADCAETLRELGVDDLACRVVRSASGPVIWIHRNLTVALMPMRITA